MKGIKRMKMLETGRGKETISSISPSPNFHGKEYRIIPIVLCFIFAYEKFVENENSLWMNTNSMRNFVECCGLGLK